MRPFVVACLFLALQTLAASAKDAPQVVTWPPTGAPVVRISLGKFTQLSSIAGQHNYVIDRHSSKSFVGPCR
jgi:hypothetical protein